MNTPKFKIGDLVYSPIMRTTLLRVVFVHESNTHIEGNLFKREYSYATESVQDRNIGLTAYEKDFEAAVFEAEATEKVEENYDTEI